MNDPKNYLEFAKELAEEAGKIMLKHFLTKSLQMDIKEDLTPVTLADTEINSMVISRVKRKFPDHGVLGEEESYMLNSEQLWIVDPLDGTPNFGRGVPVFAFSVAFVEDGQPKLGVVSDPNTERIFWAVEGGGAYENGNKLDLSNHVHRGKKVISAWVVGGVNQAVFKSNDIDGKLAAAFGKKGGFTIFDHPIAYILPMVGAGYFDACITSVINPWDLAAGCLIAQESGAKVTDIFGEEVTRWDEDINGVLVAAPDMHKEILDIIQPITEEYR
jgi:fructose-1,6-bisphosphatase/inositol monophosphatase family enzyme